MKQSTESRQNRLDELYEYGKSKGTITYKEIMDRLSGTDMDAIRWILFSKPSKPTVFPW